MDTHVQNHFDLPAAIDNLIQHLATVDKKLSRLTDGALDKRQFGALRSFERATLAARFDLLEQRLDKIEHRLNLE